MGGDGYLGWPTSVYLSSKNHDLLILDNGIKRIWEKQCGVAPLIPVPPLCERVRSWNDVSDRCIHFVDCDISAEFDKLLHALQEFSPQAIVHYAEQPSAPYSMMGREYAIETQRNNVVGTLNVIYAIMQACPDAHLIKLGTMGEYGTPNIDIEEGWLEVTHAGRTDRVLFPKRPGSIYHLSKVHDSANLEFACRTWGLRVTDLNQGVVYGIDTEETRSDVRLHTSFHYDAVFGTVLNRFVVQAVTGVPLTAYGRGNQIRGFINIRDTIRCIELAALNPASAGEFRVFNQVTAHYSVNHLAKMVQAEARQQGFNPIIESIANPRVEQEEHYYNPKYTALQQLGLVPHHLTPELISHMLIEVARHRDRIDLAQIMPKTTWR
jgi:UDP-sulfoquinovose synthase